MSDGNGAPRAARTLAAALVALSLVLAACGSSDSESSAGSTSGQPAATTETGAGTETSGGAAGDDYAAAGSYLDAEPGAADQSKPPITIGWVNTEGGAYQNQGNTRVADAAVKMINEQFGGIHGHPLELKKCFAVTSEEQGLRCAQRFLNDREISVIAAGVLDVGATPFYATMKGTKPVIGAIPTGPDVVTPNYFGIGNGHFGIDAVWQFLADDVSAKNTSILIQDTPGTRNSVANWAGQASKFDLTARGVFVPQNAPDLVAPIAAGGVAQSDASFVLPVTVPTCIAMSNAFDKLQIGAGEKPFLLTTLDCLTQEAKQQLGDWPKWTYWFPSVNPLASSEPGSESSAYLAALEANGNPDDAIAGQTPLMFATVLTAAKLMNSLDADEISPETVAEAARAFTGPVFLGAPKVAFGEGRDPGLGTEASRFYRYDGDGNWEELGGWQCAPGDHC